MKRILVVEDEVVISRLIKRMLAQSDYELTFVETLAEGLANIESGSFHALVTDLHLPDGKGTDIAHRFKERCPTSSVIMMTGSPLPDGATDADSEISGFLSKPFGSAELQTALQKALGT